MNYDLINKVFYFDLFGSEKLQAIFVGSRVNLMIYRFLAWTSFFVYISGVVACASIVAFIMNHSYIHDPRNNTHNVICSFIFIFAISSPLTIVFIDLIYKYTIYLPKFNGLTKH